MARILITEDEADLRMALRARLEMSGFAVVEATNGQEALDKMKIEKPDLLILDMMMPLMDGMEVIGRMRASDQLKAVPILVLTNYDFGFMKEVAKEGGVVEYILKAGLNLDDIPVKITQILALPDSPPSGLNMSALLDELK